MAAKFPTTQENGEYDTVDEVIESLSNLKNEDELSDDTDDTRSTISEADFNGQNVIYISGLPLNIPDQQLISALYDTFSGCGLIKLYRRTTKPSIYLHRNKFDKTKTSHAANITFEKEESVAKAIRNYNGQVIATLNNAKISVKKFDPKTKMSFPANNAIYISGLPLDIPEQRLFDTLSYIFTEIDQISINQKTKKPSIHLFKNKFDPTKLFGTASITFKKAESVAKAIRKYDGQVIQILNNAKISVKKSDPTRKTVRPPGTPSKEQTVRSTCEETNGDAKKANGLTLGSGPKPYVNNPDLIPIWIQDEGCQPIKKMLDRTSAVGDLIKTVHNGKNDGDSYQASYGVRQMTLSDCIPSSTTPNKPVKIRKIVTPQFVQNLPKKNTYTPIDYHIIVDNSNVFIGAQNVLNKETGKIQTNPGIRVNVQYLVEKALERGKLSVDIKTRVVGGGAPQRSARIWKEWESCGYRCIVGGQTKGSDEQFVDDMLHAQILKLLTLYRDTSNKQQILVLVTGDGNRNYNQTSFRSVVEMVLQTEGWKVELWSWAQSLSQIFFNIQEIFPDTMAIKYLDPYRAETTFEEQNRQN